MINTKLITGCFLIALLAVSMIAAVVIVNPTSLKFTQSDSQLTFTVTPPNGQTADYTFTAPTTILQDNGNPVTFTFSPNNPTGVVAATPITVTPIADYNELTAGKTYSGNLVVKQVVQDDPATPENETLTETLNIPISFTKSFCKSGEQGTDLEITDFKIDNSDGDDEEWSPLDEIEIEIEVTNNGNDKIKDVTVELALFNSEGKNIIDDMDDLENEEIDLGSIKEDKEDTAIFTFKVPADFEADTYKLMVKAYSEDLNEENACTAVASDFDNGQYHRIDGERETEEEKHIIFNNIKISPSPAQCSERVQLTGEVFNIGDEDYEGQVKVTLFSQELGLNLEQVVRQDLDQGDSEVVDFEFDVPEETDEKIYILEFKTYYDYDEDDDTYDIVSEDKFTTTLRVEGNCEVEVKAAQITAELDSETPEAVAGKQVIINAQLKNTGDVETAYTISVSGNSAWSNLVSLDPQTVTLAPGESKQVDIVLSIDKDAEGDQEFTIRASFDDQKVEQKVALSVSAEAEAQLGPVVEHLRANWFIYLIILINIILIIAIILVIRSMVAPRPM